jgi:transcriptional regulator with XRE-family HTH domain
MEDFASTIRRREFGAFLRSRRERLTPERVELPAGFRRRTPGLRREEVALLAGVGVTWYTWLEQGRDVQASAEVLGSIGDALRLEPAERNHLFALAGRPQPPRPARGPESIDAPLRRLLDSLELQPAYVMGRRWDVIAWNAGAAMLFGDYAALEGDARNLMHMLFCNPAHRRLLIDWQHLAPHSLAMFRADSARYADDPDFLRLIDTLSRESPDFRHWWAKREILPPLAGHKRIRHPAFGPMTFEYTSFAVMGDQDLKLVVYTPLAEDRTQQKLRDALAAKATPEFAGSGSGRADPHEVSGSGA